MTTQTELNLIGVFFPICLLKCKSTLHAMHPGERMDVLVSDPEVLDELEKIIRRSKDQIIHRLKKPDHCRLRIQKG